jgi:putative DNA modification/repair radical SAM protein
MITYSHHEVICMEIMDKLAILSDAAKYDVSCSSSGSSRNNSSSGIGNAALGGICHSWSADGRCISLLKILMTNYCKFDCAYCINRRSNDVPRAIFSPEEIAELTINFYRRNYIEGLFLSSGVFRDPDHTMELILRTLVILREVYSFNGYIHAKAIPGASRELVKMVGIYADRVSVNIELPSSESLALLAPDKTYSSIFKPMEVISRNLREKRPHALTGGKSRQFVPAGQTTQLIVGASPETDRNILLLSQNLYRKVLMKRVYYSAYVPVSDNPLLPAVTSPPLQREHRIYQADWLMRFYGFGAEEILDVNTAYLDEELDPKSAWALRNLHLFPMEINRVSYSNLLRIPGIGVRSAKRIVRARKVRNLTLDNLKKLGVVIRRARYFITCNGQFHGGNRIDSIQLRSHLRSKQGRNIQNHQLPLFPLFHEATASKRINAN